MTDRLAFTRRGALVLGGAAAAFATTKAVAQPSPQPAFGYEDVVRRARDLARQPYDPSARELPEGLRNLTFDQYRDIRFRPDRALFAAGGGPFRMQFFHPGFLYRRPVVVNVVRDGIATPAPYSGSLFDYGGNKFDRPLPVDLGFAGFRLHYPLNDPRVFDELISFIGASYFRVLGRNQVYGISARGVAIDSGGPNAEEFPDFREFWVEMPGANADRATIYALLDGPSLAGAYRFVVYPDVDTVVDVTATLIARKPIAKLGIAPLTSMFFYGENQRRHFNDFRPELHDSDGLLLQTGGGEWVWRPLRNPKTPQISSFLDANPRGFGLMQRDRLFEHYQDLDLAYQLRPSYWVEPREGWGAGRVELVELPTDDETNDNIVAFWVSNEPVEAGQERVYGYRLKSLSSDGRMHPGGRAVNTYPTRAAALGSAEPVPPGAQRFIIDFAGGDLPYYLNDPSRVQVAPSSSSGRIGGAFVTPNPRIGGFRVGIDVQADTGRAMELRAFLKAGERALTETWTFTYAPENA
ncbi:glucan biosynthesis protein [Methylopila turkensis]|uniref:Glucans biosynthesis protein G n=1 Tax=Methylopila turkensis TaxID=1437816 RepID=A0A9W6JQD0_9HYPH|nr:glucan biosynthesis protein G [Methylopila turkensis]GLK80429.1 glucans biosynthesis protein G [Methylopila turkensis]